MEKFLYLRNYFIAGKFVMRLWRSWKRKVRLISVLLLFPVVILFFVVISFQSDLADGNSKEVNVIRKDSKQVEYIDKRGIHVIVGHYIGNDLPWDTTPNLTDGNTYIFSILEFIICFHIYINTFNVNLLAVIYKLSCSIYFSIFFY